MDCLHKYSNMKVNEKFEHRSMNVDLDLFENKSREHFLFCDY